MSSFHALDCMIDGYQSTYHYLADELCSTTMPLDVVWKPNILASGDFILESALGVHEQLIC